MSKLYIQADQIIEQVTGGDGYVVDSSHVKYINTSAKNALDSKMESFNVTINGTTTTIRNGDSFTIPQVTSDTILALFNTQAAQQDLINLLVSLGFTQGGGETPVEKQNITISVSMSGWTYGQTASNPSVSGNTGNGAVTYKYKVSTAADSTYSGTKPSNAGTYTIQATVAETTNYYGATATTNFTIAKANINPTVSMSGWTEGDTASNPSVSGNIDNGTVTYKYKVSTAADSTYTTTKPSTAGTYTVQATIAATTNYNGGIATANFTISAAQPQETYYWYVGYNQDAYENPQGFKSNMYTTTTNSMPTEYTKTGNNGLNVASTGTTPNYLIMIIPSSWEKPKIYTQLKDAEINMTLEKQNISITGISEVTFNVYSGTGTISDSQVFIN